MFTSVFQKRHMLKYSTFLILSTQKIFSIYLHTKTAKNMKVQKILKPVKILKIGGLTHWAILKQTSENHSVMKGMK